MSLYNADLITDRTNLIPAAHSIYNLLDSTYHT
jgi:hypothetical protein